MTESHRRSGPLGDLTASLVTFIATGALIALGNWAWTFITSGHARSLLVALLALGGLSGAGAGVLMWGVWLLIPFRSRGVVPARFFLAAALIGLPVAWVSTSIALVLQARGLTWIPLILVALLLLALYGWLSMRVAAVLEEIVRRAGPRLRTAGRVSRRLAFLLTVAGGIAAAAYVMMGRRVTSRDLAEVPAPESRRPNLILVSLDTLRPDHLPSRGYSRPTTPRLDEILAGGAVFTDSVASSSWTILSHATLLTGASPSRIGPSMLQSAASGALTLPPEARTMAEVLHDNGYATAAFIGGATLSSAFGFDQGFDHFDDVMAPSMQSVTDLLLLGGEIRSILQLPRSRFLASLDPFLVGINNVVQGQRQLPMSDSYLAHASFPRRFSNTASEVNYKLRSYLEGADLTRPQFLFVHYFDPHDPFDAPPPFGGRWADHGDGLGYILDNGLVQRVMRDGIPLTDKELDKLIALYDENLTVLDAGLGELMEMLDRKGLLRDSILAFFSDHGESFGEHGRLFHGHSLSEELIRNLFAVQYPGRIPPGLAPAAQVGAVDIMPTLLDLAGVRSEGRIGDGEGRSLVPILTGEAPPDGPGSPAFSELYAGAIRETTFGIFERDHFSVRLDGWKLVADSAGSRHLYHLASDPGELMDRVEAEPEKARELEAMLVRWRARGFKKSDADEEIDPRRLEELKGLGYVGP